MDKGTRQTGVTKAVFAQVLLVIWKSISIEFLSIISLTKIHR